MKFEKKRGGFSISFGGGMLDKLTNKVHDAQADLNKWKEVVDFMARRAESGDVIAEKWVQEITLEMEKASDNMVKMLSLSKKMFTETNRVAVNDAIERNFKLKDFISAADWENRAFYLEMI